MYYDIDNDYRHCTQCGGPLVLLGVLGDLEHSRCRNCGMNHEVQCEDEASLARAAIEQAEQEVGI